MDLQQFFCHNPLNNPPKTASQMLLVLLRVEFKIKEVL